METSYWGISLSASNGLVQATIKLRREKRAELRGVNTFLLTVKLDQYDKQSTFLP